MGYILPIHNYQYEQYVKRDVGNNPISYKNVEVYSLQALANNVNNKTAAPHLSYKYASEKRRGDSMHLVAELTGKGKKFQAFI